MRGNRFLIPVALLLLLGAGGFLLWSTGIIGGGGGDEIIPTPTPDMANFTEIVVAIQNIPRGMQIRAEDNAMELQPWHNDYLPLEYIASLQEVEGKFARTDIPRGMPVLPGMLTQGGGAGIAADGSPASFFAPNDRVAYAVPMDTQGSVAWALKPGDHVDVVAALQMMAVGTEAAEGIRQFTYLEENDMPSQTSLYGRFEQLPNGRWAAIYSPGLISNAPPLLLVQLTVQDAVVWHVGVWVDEIKIGDEPAAAAAEAAPAGTPGASGGLLAGGAATEATPAPVAANKRKDVEPITLLLKREDVLVLKYLMEMGADLDFVLRPAGFTDTVIQTQPVWFRYVMDRYQLPDAMPDMPLVPTAVRDQLQLPSLATPTPAE